MADQAYPDGDLAYPNGPNAYGPAQYPINTGFQRIPSSRPDIDARLKAKDDARRAAD